MIRIVIADGHALIRVGLRTIIDAESGMQIVGEAATGREAVALCRDLSPDVLILDFDMSDIDGLEATTQILASKPAPRVLILTMHDNEEYAIRLIQAGASGFMIKNAPPSELPAAIRKVSTGKIYITPAVSERIAMRQLQSKNPSDTPLTQLSNRELQVLVRLAKGLSPKEIADELNLSYSTVQNYKHRILDKLDLRNNSDITRFAIRHQLINELR